MKLNTQLVFLGAAVILTTSAFADTTTVPKNSVYLSGDIGYGNLSTPNDYPVDPNSDFITGTSYSTHSVTSGVNLGFNHAITNHILVGGEVGWNYDGKAKYTTDFGDISQTLTINSYDIHALATSTYLFSNGLNLFGKAGAARVYQKGVWSATGWYDQYVDTTQYHPMLAVGAGYQIKMINTFVQYSHIFGQNAHDLTDVFNSQGEFTTTVAVDTIKLGVAVSLAI